MKKLLIGFLALTSLPAFAGSLACETAINNVVRATAHYVEVKNNPDPQESLSSAQTMMDRAIELAYNTCQ